MMSTDLTATQPCPEWADLKAWADRELDTVHQAALDAHVRACASCQEEARLMRQIGTTLRQLEGSVDPSPELRERILARVGERARPAWWTLPGNPFAMLRWVTVATAVLVVGTVGRNALVTDSREMARRTGSAPPPTAAPMAQTKGAENKMEAGDPTAGAMASGGAPAASAMDTTTVTAQPSAPVAPKEGARAMAGAPAESPSLAGRAPMGMPGGGEKEQSQWRSNAVRQRRAASTLPEYRRPSPQRVSPSDVNQYTRGKALEDVKRKVVRGADLTVRTRSPLEGVQKEIQTRLQKDDGYVEASNLTVPAGTERTAKMTLRVPVDKLDGYLTWLASLGEVQAKSVHGEDVTGTWVDQRAEVRELRKEEARLLKTYETHPNRERREEAQRLLLHLRPRIAVAEERFAFTGKLAALSTLTLTLIEPEQVRVQGSLWQDLDRTTRSAVAAFMVALRVPAALLIWLIVFSPLWVPCLFLYRWAARKSQEWPQRQ